MIELHIRHRVVDSIETRRIAYSSLCAFLWGYLEFSTVFASNANLTECYASLSTRTGSRYVFVIGTEKLQMFPDEAMDWVERFGIFGSK